MRRAGGGGGSADEPCIPGSPRRTAPFGVVLSRPPWSFVLHRDLGHVREHACVGLCVPAQRYGAAHVLSGMQISPSIRQSYVHSHSQGSSLMSGHMNGRRPSSQNQSLRSVRWTQ